MNDIQKELEQLKVDREVNENNETHEFRLGYVKAMCHAINLVKNLDICGVTSSYFDKIQKGFKKLQEDCTEVRLVGFCQKEDIPDEAHREEFEEEFDHEYQLTQSDGYDEASFWGDIYLQLDGTLYMRFDVIG